MELRRGKTQRSIRDTWADNPHSVAVSLAKWKQVGDQVGLPTSLDLYEG